MAKRVTIQDALDYCLANPEGLSSDELLGKFPQYRAELQPLLTLGASIQSISPPPVPMDRRAAMKARLMSAAAAQQPTQAAAVVASTPAVATSEPVTQPRAIGQAAKKPAAARRGWDLAWLKRPAWAAAAAAAVLVAMFWWGAAGALPDSPLYAVKLAAETLQTGLGRTAAEEARNHIHLANDRLRDLRTMYVRGELNESNNAFLNYRDHLSNSATYWKQTAGSDRVDLAKLLYGSSLAGQQTFRDFQPIVSSLQAPIQTSIQEINSVLGSVNRDTGQALRTAGIDPSSVSIPPDLVAAVTPTSVISPANITATVVAQASPTRPDRSTPSAGVTNPTALAHHATNTARAIARETSRASGTASPTTVQTSVATATTVISPTSVAASPTAQTPSPEPTRTARPTNTSRPTQTARPTNTSRPTQTATASGGQPTSTVARTQTRVATVTPGRPSHTPRPTDGTAPPTPSARPSGVPMPPTPSARPTNILLPPTPSARPSGVPVPSNTRVPPPPPPTDTAIVVPTASVCDLNITSVSVVCASSGCASWTAQVRNGGATNVTFAWTAELQINQGGGFQTVDTQTGTIDIGAGSTVSFEGSFCYTAGPGSNVMRVRFAVQSNGTSCNRDRVSPSVPHCVEPRPTNTPRPRPTEEPTEPRPTNTRRPHPNPTEEPTEPLPTSTSRPRPTHAHEDTPEPTREPTRPPQAEPTRTPRPDQNQNTHTPGPPALPSAVVPTITLPVP